MHKQLTKLKLVILTTLILLSTLFAAVIYSYSGDQLLSSTVLVLTTFMLAFPAIKFYQSFTSSFVCKEFQAHPKIVKSQGELTAELQKQILSSLFSSWSTPVAVFNNDGLLTFFNNDLAQQVSTPLCRGITMQECGFIKKDGNWQHQTLQESWKIEGFYLPLNNSLVIIASNIGQQLQTAKKQSQNDLIRILSHELNNSLTPIASLADTLLTAKTLTSNQTENILTRIKTRSERLLEFIQSYSQLSRLPESKSQRFSLRAMAYDIAAEYRVQLNYKGLSNCYADPVLFEQLLINLFKNSVEACDASCEITMVNDYQLGVQQIVLLDNGSGFSNLDNAVTPLYTTKHYGQGLGLSICADIVNQHNGKMTLANQKQGAKVSIELPVSASL